MIAIRAAAPEDLPSIERIVSAAYQRYVARIGKPPAPMLDDYAEQIARGEAWVALLDGVVRGVLVLEPGSDHLLLDNVAVDPSAQGQGLGRALIGYAEAEATRRGFYEVRLYTNELMTENLALYPRLGFRETHRAIEQGYARVYFSKPIGT